MTDDRFRSTRGSDGALIAEPQPGIRRRAVLIVIAVAAAGAAAIAALEQWLPLLQDWVASDQEQSVARLNVVLLVMAGFVDLPLVFAAVYLWRLGLRTIRAERFPPPGVTVIKSTPVLTGDRAKRRGRLAQIAAIILFATSTVMVALLVWLAMQLQS